MDDEKLTRYSRQILIPEIDVVGQNRLLESTVLVVGMGGLGSPATMYLAACGIGHLVINDHDHVDLSNLQRQIIHNTHDLNRRKVDSALDTLAALNPDIRISPIAHRLEASELTEEVKRADVVVDASDNFATRYLLNSICVTSGVPLIWGAVTRLKGQVTTFCNTDDNDPCLNCLFQDAYDSDTPATCGEGGILSPIAGVIGSLMALEAIKILLDIGTNLCGRLLRLDAIDLTWHQSQYKKDPQCNVCGNSDRKHAAYSHLRRNLS